MVEASTSDALERPVGARGALRTADFFSGKGNGALSSLAAAAGAVSRQSQRQ
jgi:hypothetical protein